MHSTYFHAFDTGSPGEKKASIGNANAYMNDIEQLALMKRSWSFFFFSGGAGVMQLKERRSFQGGMEDGGWRKGEGGRRKEEGGGWTIPWTVILKL